MTEREMLELAAKAAGIKIDPIDAMHEPDEWACWNPLTDDADCFRLEDALDIEIQRTQQAVMVYANGGPTIFEYYTDHESKSAARRFASTRLAAKIGHAL